MNTNQIFNRLWKDYSDQNPSAEKIHKLITSKGNEIINDHVAFRTFDDPRVSVDVLANVFIKAGYEQAGEYVFPAKKLRAKHYEIPGDNKSPRVFISQLNVDDFSEFLQSTVKTSVNRISEEMLKSDELIFDGNAFGTPDYKVYERLRKESEYAAWVYAFGFRANHFTISVNNLKTLQGIEEVNELIKSNGFLLNNSGGEIKGNREDLLKQSSTLADKVDHKFIQGLFQIPSCYYEFAERFKDESGNLFNGFIAGSADKIFESTDFRK